MDQQEWKAPSPAELMALLRGTALESAEVALLDELPTRGNQDPPVQLPAVRLDSAMSDAAVLQAWKTLRSLMPQTGCWPAVVTDLALTMSPTELDADPLDVSDWLGRRRLDQAFPEGHPLWKRDASWWQTYPSATMRSDHWGPEFFNFGSKEDLSVVLLPAGRPESIALVSYFHCGLPHDRDVVEGHLGLAQATRNWNRDFGAEPVASLGMDLRFLVSRPPITLAAAVVLASEHADIGVDQFDRVGMSIAEYATTLVGSEYWYLFTKP